MEDVALIQLDDTRMSLDTAAVTLVQLDVAVPYPKTWINNDGQEVEYHEGDECMFGLNMATEFIVAGAYDFSDVSGTADIRGSYWDPADLAICMTHPGDLEIRGQTAHRVYLNYGENVQPLWPVRS
jgi:hypothetical protein